MDIMPVKSDPSSILLSLLYVEASMFVQVCKLVAEGIVSDIDVIVRAIVYVQSTISSESGVRKSLLHKSCDRARLLGGDHALP